MKAVLILLGLAVMVAARPDIDLDLEDFHHEQDIAEDTSVTGSYRWTSPEGVEYYVKYVADEDGFRILESNAVPATADGVSADGSQGSFISIEDLDDFFDDK
ncbi:uncharacterized protein [Panulirus ornatus]|uniref:uncharacterized protein n=1 Tax=Panulirus ornatus TaxID=150431 RepID=UPI003A8997DD